MNIRYKERWIPPENSFIYEKDMESSSNHMIKTRWKSFDSKTFIREDMESTESLNLKSSPLGQKFESLFDRKGIGEQTRTHRVKPKPLVFPGDVILEHSAKALLNYCRMEKNAMVRESNDVPKQGCVKLEHNQDITKRSFLKGHYHTKRKMGDTLTNRVRVRKCDGFSAHENHYHHKNSKENEVIKFLN